MAHQSKIFKLSQAKELNDFLSSQSQVYNVAPVGDSVLVWFNDGKEPSKKKAKKNEETEETEA